ncbi:formate dehydrogenase accessory sulfurtransferase FdhD [Luteibacter yeojuensis]|uniref:Sulfur carrier protein FdhD n=1 Tax=Luteibacter yeojuensis TaxID=345309 RepID=A0A0F3L4G9_9GAMM|nr:formate dehydrogenase accessory sulfurtransferase FdhD [Luteibacter yeojuensis]KJV37254.1 formate dehydrogenase [Luteibacter yeojuensis]
MRHEHIPPAGSASRTVTRYERGRAVEDKDRLAEEIPVAIHVNGAPFAVMMASPVDLEDFARGFALTENRVGDVREIDSIEIHEVLEGITIDVRTMGAGLPAMDGDPPSHKERNIPGRSGCGICGTRELEDVIRRPRPVAAGTNVSPDAIERALEALRAEQPINAYTGSVHAAAWARADGSLVVVREDVGRHNALDKLVGAMTRRGLDPREGFAVITSRASYEMVTKAAVAGITVLVAISAPTALAVSLAADCGLTLVGFARTSRFNVYSRPERIKAIDV